MQPNDGDTPPFRLPDPRLRNPLMLPQGVRDPATVFLTEVIDHPNIQVGDWTYYNDRTLPENYAETLAPYLFPGAPEHLRIGRFCQIAQGVQFVTATANHPMTGASTFPFAVFDPPRFGSYRASLPRGRDTIVGHDCWIGREAMLLPGAELGNGVIVAARSVVRGPVPDFAVVAGNPAKVIRMRYDDQTIQRLNALAWWSWASDQIERAIGAIEAGDVAALEQHFNTTA
ncbi:acetyltransferase [Tateyamaria omphalii]|uniref:CatB-related O-acetyltransferase n=1 Tax=Tateyamaria omphalii TaxID=299262 RepID=UPI00167524F2|nr:CatB-related O-acetyltransferase [Tateyamaria omphalii]GGX48183.1 acetyltransferase [Tateyamaria omphalii]